MSNIELEHLKKYEFFRNLPDHIILELANEIEEVGLTKDEVLFEKGDPGDALYLIRSGWVKLVSEDADGSEVVLNQVGPGNIVGEMAMVDEEPRSAGIVALTPVALLKLKSETFKSVLARESSLGIQVIKDLSDRLRFANTYLENAIEWSQKIASGDYSFAKQEMKKAQATIELSKQGDEDRANRFLATFFSMVEDIKQREGLLQNELAQLIIEIDDERRIKDVEELTGSDFFNKLKLAKENKKKTQQKDN